MPLISVRNLSKVYDNEGVETRALDRVSFDIGKGEFVSIMGPSGSGKSTLMQVLGLLDRPTDGEYSLDGKNVFSHTDDDLARLRNKRIGFVFQSFNLRPRTSVTENVELPLLYDEKAVENNDLKVSAALEAVGLSHRAGYLSNQLSGGEKQRAAIARALVNNPDIIFADEPTGNLDSKSGLQVMRILQGLNDSGRTIILVTHETFTAEHGKRMLRMLDGKIVADEPVVRRRIADGEDTLLK
jgi:putative ABC transport system ATP-binding protein